MQERDKETEQKQTQWILGISGYYHDSAAALIHDGAVVAAAQEERFSRIRHDPAFPQQAIRYCLDSAGIDLSQVSAIAYYEKPFIKFERLLETYLANAPTGFRSFSRAMPVWLKEKLYLKAMLRRGLRDLEPDAEIPIPPFLFSDHHRAHAASAFYASGYADAAVLCVDGVGEWATTSLWHADSSGLRLLEQIDFPHSIGLLYSAFTEYCGFRVNSGEYKLMGLAPYGRPRYTQRIEEHLVSLHEDGSYSLRGEYFDYCVGSHMINERFCTLFEGPARQPESEIEQRHKDLAASIQVVTEKLLLRLCNALKQRSGSNQLCLAGGVALNCVANTRIRNSELFDAIWVQPASGDAGGALGAALLAWHEHFDHHYQPSSEDRIAGALLGPEYSNEDIESTLQELGADYQKLDNPSLMQAVSERLTSGAIVGWFQSRMEFGPRALGARSILANPQAEGMHQRLNRSIKFREGFRPFAPAMLAEKVADYFDLAEFSSYMTFVSQAQATGNGTALPAVTHVDGSARVQAVDPTYQQSLHSLLQTFYEHSGCPALVNTSFNVRGEPIVATPQQAYRCFMRSEMDVLAIGDLLLEKSRQPSGYVIGPQQPEKPSVPASDKTLRLFGSLLAGILAALSLWVIDSSLYQRALWFVALLLALLAIFAPGRLRIPHLLFERVGHRIRTAVNVVILGICFYGMFTPFGFAARLGGYDPLNQRAKHRTSNFSTRPNLPLDMTKPY